jgi:tetratricopeptide (TPR) repeat protein
MDERLRELMKLGREAYKKKEYSRAETYLIQVMEGQDRYADVYNMLGVIYHDRGLFSKAQKNFAQALEINPNYTEAALNLAVTCNDLGRYEEAKEIYAKVLSVGRTEPGELDPFVRGKIANMYAEIGDVYFSSALYENAATEYRKALTMGPGFVDIRLKLAQALRDGGDREGAIAEFRNILADRPTFVAARVHLGITLYAQGKYTEAIAEWREALRIDPANKSCKMYLNLVKDGTSKPGEP